MNKIYAFIVSALIVMIPLLTALAWALNWATILKILLTIWFTVEWAMIATVVEMFAERKEKRA